MQHPHYSQTYGYARVSSTGQNLARQLVSLRDAGVQDNCIFTDKQSGKDFNRPAWKRLLKKMRAGDLLIVTSLDRFGRNYVEMIDVWRHLVKNRGINIRVLDMPILDTATGDGLTSAFIGDLVLRILSYVAESERAHIKQRQKEGIAAAKSRGVRFGRPSITLPPNYHEIVKRFHNGELTTGDACALIGVSKSTFLRLRTAKT